MKKALITGASSGMGREFAYELSKMGYELILTARRKEKLEETAALCENKCRIIEGDLSKHYNQSAIKGKKVANANFT